MTKKLGSIKERLGALLTDPEVAKKRLKGLAWECANATLVLALGFAANNLDLINGMSPEAKLLIGGILALIINQVTKQANSK